MLKIDYDPRIQRLEEQMPTPRPLESFFQRVEVPEEVLQGIDTTSCFADDTNTKLLQKGHSLGGIKRILYDFERISGLKCNIDKTCVMLIGPIDPVEAPQIEEMGFSIVDKIKILGLWISRERIVDDNNFASATNNIRKLIAQWAQYNLSLIGRISISKTFLISQLTYLGAVLTPKDDCLLTIKQLIENYVIGKMPLAKDRIYRKPDTGGLGLIDIGQLLDSLKCSWFQRIQLDGVNDNWRLGLYSKCFFNPLCFRPEQLDIEERPLEYAIGMSFWRFLQAFWNNNHNHLKAPLLLNPVFCRALVIMVRWTLGL